MPQDFRTFVAIEIPEPIRRHLIQFAQSYAQWNEFRWVDSDNLHITLNFVGDVSQQDISSLCRKIEAIAEESAPFLISLRGTGAFPKIERPRVAFAGVDQGAQEMQSIYSRVSELLESLRYDRDRHPFRPHVTLARLKRDRRAPGDFRRFIDENRTVEFGEFTTHQVVVFESILEKSGPRYTPLARIELRGRGNRSNA